jgi:ribose transport system substrate-binding protein
MEFHSLRWRHLIGLALIAALALFVTACGSDDDSSSSSNTGGGSTSAEETGGKASGVDIAALEATVNEHIEPGTIGPTVPIEKPVPKDAYAVFINCGAPACVSFEESFNEAASELGWKVDNVAVEPTPESIQEGFGEAVRRKPDAVVTSGFAIEQYPKQAQELNSLEIPILSNTGTDPSTYDPKDGVTLQLQEPQEVSEAAAIMADKAIVDAGGEGEFGAVNLTGYPSVEIQVTAFEEEIKSKCPDCSVQRLEVQPTSLGKDAPQIVSNFLRANPDIKGLYFGYDGIALGLGAALKGAGITPPDTYAWAPDEPGIQELQAGEKTAAVPLGFPETGWQMADAIIRLQNGENIEDSQPWEPYVLWSKAFDNVPTDTKNPPAYPDYQEEFKKLWGIG